MFWNRKKRNQQEETRKAHEENIKSAMDWDRGIVNPEPNISEPIKAFLAASGRWEMKVIVEPDNHRTVREVTDPDTGLSIRVLMYGGMGGVCGCDNHSWVTWDEAEAIWHEFGRIRKSWEEDQDRKIRQKWTEAYKNRGEVV